jgi:hypothetical protein
MERPGPETAARVHGSFFIAGGLWPVLHIRSFEAITGPKFDRWLVKTVGLLLSVIGVGLLRAAKEGRVTSELRFIGSGASIALTAIDVVYVSRRRISPIYLLDGVAHMTAVLAWRLFRSPEEELPDVTGEVSDSRDPGLPDTHPRGGVRIPVVRVSPAFPRR